MSDFQTAVRLNKNGNQAHLIQSKQALLSGIIQIIGTI